MKLKIAELLAAGVLAYLAYKIIDKNKQQNYIKVNSKLSEYGNWTTIDGYDKTNVVYL